MAYLDYFSDARLELQKEVMQHPDLMPLLAKHPASEFELRIAEIACYCEIVLDGAYSQQEIDKLCEILTKRLRAKRMGIIIVQELPAAQH